MAGDCLYGCRGRMTGYVWYKMKGYGGKEIDRG